VFLAQPFIQPIVIVGTICNQPFGNPQTWR
jgi:hypothetical protein